MGGWTPGYTRALTQLWGACFCPHAIAVCLGHKFTADQVTEKMKRLLVGGDTAAEMGDFVRRLTLLMGEDQLIDIDRARKLMAMDGFVRGLQGLLADDAEEWARFIARQGMACE